MTYIIKIIILFLILFNFRLPIVYNSAVLSVIITSLYYLTVWKSFSLQYFFKKYTITVLISLLLMTFIVVCLTVLHKEYDYTLTKAMVLQFFLLFSIVYALPILIDLEKEDIFEQAMRLIVWTFAAQGFIIFLCFLIPSMGAFMIAMKPEDFQVRILGPHDIYFRGYALSGSPFFELPAAFGVSFMLFMRLLVIKGQKYFTGITAYIVFALLLLGILCTGRTAFVGMGLGVLLGLISLRFNFSLLYKALKTIVVLGVLILFILPSFMPNLRAVLYEDVFPFAFEAFYNYQETGEFSTTSTDALTAYHYFSLPEDIVLHGDGRFENKDGSYHMGTDAGYMRSIIYGGIFFTLCLIIYQFVYFGRPLKLSQNSDIEEDSMNFWLFALLFVHLFFLEYKGLTIGTQHIMQVLLVFLGTAYLEGYYKKEENLYEIEE